MKRKLLPLLLLALLPLTLFAYTTTWVGFKSDGYYLGLRTSDLVGFYGKKPTSQAVATVPTRTALESKGLVATPAATTASATTGAATLNATYGTITSESITTAAGAAYTLTLTNSAVTATSIVLASVDNGTNTTAGIELGRVTPAAGSCTILVWNRHASAALNGTIKVNFAVAK